MEVTDTVVRLRGDLLITNVSGDTIHIGEYGSDEDNWFPLEVGSGVAVQGQGEGIGVVSDGVSEVGILPGGTGIFPPAVDLGDVDLSGVQPLDADLTAIAALSTTSYGRAILTLADAAALGALIGSQVYGKAQPIVTVTGTTHTVSTAEAGSLIRCTNVAGCTITVPKDVTDDVPDGIYYDVEQAAAGQVTFTAESGATCTPPADYNAKTRVQRSRVGLQKTAANTWSIFGDMEAA